MADKAILRSNTYIVGAGGPGDVDIHSNDGSINVTKESSETSKSAFNIEVANQARNEWGKITGDIFKQTDLQELVGTKQDKLTQGSGIIISPENVISANIDLSEYAKKSEIPNSYDKSETYTKDEVNNIVDSVADGKADKGDSYTKSESDAKYALKGDVPTDVYTKTEADEKFATKEEIPDPYTLPVASETVLGGIKVGENLTIDEDGTLNANCLTEVSWGSIIGTLDDQSDLKDALDGKQPVGDYALKSEVPDAYTKTESDARYQEKGNYLTPTDISDMETKTHASATYQPKGDYALNGSSYTKSESDEKYQGKLSAGENITISEDNVISATGGGSESNVAQFTRQDSIDDINAAIDAGKVVCIIDDGRVYWFDRRNNGGKYLYFYGADTYSGFLYSLSYQGTYWSRKQTVVQKKLTAGENITIDANNVISATGGVDAYTKEESDEKFATKEEIPDVSTLVPKTVTGSNANWNWSFSDNPINMGLKFEGTAAPTGALIGVDNTHATMPGGYIELNAIPGASTSGKKVVLTPSGIDFTRTDGSTYQPVYTDIIGSTYGVYTDKLTKIDSNTYGYYIDTKKMQMWNGGTADAPLGSIAKISSGSVMVAASGQYETSPIPLSKLEGTGLTVSMHGQSLGASVGLAGVKFTTSAGVTHSLENKQDKLTFATDTQIDALFA